MKSKYGELPKEAFDSYIDRLVPKVFKLLPLKEEGCETLDEYIDSMVRELLGTQNVVTILKGNGDFLSLVGTLDSLTTQSEYKNYRRDVLKCISLVKKMKESLSG